MNWKGWGRRWWSNDRYHPTNFLEVPRKMKCLWGWVSQTRFELETSWILVSEVLLYEPPCSVNQDCLDQEHVWHKNSGVGETQMYIKLCSKCLVAKNNNRFYVRGKILVGTRGLRLFKRRLYSKDFLYNLWPSIWQPFLMSSLLECVLNLTWN